LNVCDLRTVRAGREELAPGDHRPRHRHLDAYAIVMIRGGFEQISYAGRVRVLAGQLIVQPTLDCHANHLLSRGAQILRLPWHHVADLGGVYAVRDLDAIVRAAERDVIEAVALARESCTRALRGADDLPDQLAAALVRQPVSIASWAQRMRVARETVSRSFTAAYGISARRFRIEVQTRAAWLRIVRGREPLAAIASAAGFADQAHMTRNVRALTGAPPAAWRGRDLDSALTDRRSGAMLDLRELPRAPAPDPCPGGGEGESSRRQRRCPRSS
jgi:AraC-like DNA-binding protein